jgi:hypothetical protein
MHHYQRVEAREYQFAADVAILPVCPSQYESRPVFIQTKATCPISFFSPLCFRLLDIELRG